MRPDGESRSAGSQRPTALLFLHVEYVAACHAVIAASPARDDGVTAADVPPQLLHSHVRPLVSNENPPSVSNQQTCACGALPFFCRPRSRPPFAARTFPTARLVVHYGVPKRRQPQCPSYSVRFHPSIATIAACCFRVRISRSLTTDFIFILRLSQGPDNTMKQTEYSLYCSCYITYCCRFVLLFDKAASLRRH